MPKKVDRAARREEIMAAAVRVFARKGYASSRIEDVAAEAGIAKGAVYLYFDSRDALLAAAFGAYAEETGAMMASAEGDTPLQRLESLVHLVINAAAARPDHARLLLDLWSKTPALQQWSQGPMRDMTAVYEQYRGSVAEFLRQARQRGEIRPDIGDHYAIVVVGAIEGCLLQWLIDPRIPLTELAAPIVSTCLDGIRV